MTLNPQQFRSVYHGTTSQFWDSIAQEGLKPSKQGPTVTEKKSVARQYASSAVTWNDGDPAKDSGIVVRANIPSRVFHGYVDTGGSSGFDKSYSLRRPIPPKYLKRES